MLVAVNCCYLSELEDLLFLLHLMCASYGHELYMCFDVCHAIFTQVYAMYFCDLCVTSTSMQSRLRNVSDFRDSDFSKSVTAVILLPCIHVSTERSMLLLVIFSKDVLWI